MKTLLAIALLWSALISINLVRGGFQYEAQVGSYWSLADKSSTIEQKALYIDRFVNALAEQNFYGQHDAMFYPTDDNSFDKNFQALNSLQTRLHEIQGMDIKSFEYQTAIQQITAQEQGEAQPMLDIFKNVWWKNHHWTLWGVPFGVNLSLNGIVWILFAIVGIRKLNI